MIGFQTIGNAALIAHDGEPKAGARFTAISGSNFHFGFRVHGFALGEKNPMGRSRAVRDRKSTRLNSSHTVISYAVFCLKKKKKFKKKKYKNEQKISILV